MDQIEVIIKLQNKNLIYYMLIGRSDKIEKLKEQCEKISDVPPNQQILIYKGKILSNDKLISDYNIDNGDNIILNKKKDLSSANILLKKNSGSSNLINYFLEKNNIMSLNNKEINFTEFANFVKKNPDLLSFLRKMDFDRLDNFYQLIGIGNTLDIFHIDPQKDKQILNKPEIKDLINMLQDPSILEILFNNPKLKQLFRNYPIFLYAIQNLEKFNSFHNLQMAKNMLKKDDEKSMIESSNTEVPVPPDPFEKSQMLNSSRKI